MAYPTLNDANVTGLDGLFSYAADVVPILPSLILFGIFAIVTLGSFFATRNRFGPTNFAGSFAVGGFITMVVAVAFSIIGFVNLSTLVVTIAVAILGFMWLVFSERE